MSNENMMPPSWGQRVQSDLANLDIKSLGRIGVLLGGRSGEREISLISGNGVLDALLSKGVDAYPFDPGLRSPMELAGEKFDRIFISLQDVEMVVADRQPYAYPKELYRWHVDGSLPELSEADLLNRGEAEDAE